METKETQKRLTEERIKEIVNILLPYGYSERREGGYYLGVSPYANEFYNIIEVITDPDWTGSVLSIVMEKWDDEADDDIGLGYYIGIMKLIAPELATDDTKFKDEMNVLDFRFAREKEMKNAFKVNPVQGLRK